MTSPESKSPKPPKKIIRVEIEFSETEYKKFLKFRASTPPGTTASVIREKLGFNHTASGQKNCEKISEEEYLLSVNLNPRQADHNETIKALLKGHFNVSN